MPPTGGSRLAGTVLAPLLASTLLAWAPPARAQQAANQEPRSESPADAWWGPDKALHMGISFGLAALGYGLGAWAFDDRLAAAGFGASVAIGIGAGKEALDAAGLGQPSWRDFAWDVVGATLGIGVAVSFDAALRGP